MEEAKKIIYIQYTNPGGYPPLEHSSQILANLRWKVLFLGTGCLGANELVLAEHPNIRVKTMTFCKPGLFQKIHYMIFTLWVIGITLLKRPRWVYTSDSFACLPGVVLLFFGIKVLYHEHDSPNAREQINPTAWLMFIAAMRRALGRNAQLVILPNQDRLRVFQRETERVKESLCVWNCPAVGEVKARRLSKQPSFLLALYHGSIGPSRLPLTVVDALARCDLRIKLRIVGYETVGHQGYITILTDRARQLGVLDHIEIRPAVPRKDLFSLCHDCDFGLALMPMKSNDINMQNMTGASNKPFDYLACGLALLVSDLPEWNTMYVKAGYGLACTPEDPDSIAHAFRWYVDHFQEMQAMGEKGRQKILKEWNYEMQFAPVLKNME